MGISSSSSSNFVEGPPAFSFPNLASTSFSVPSYLLEGPTIHLTEAEIRHYLCFFPLLLALDLTVSWGGVFPLVFLTSCPLQSNPLPLPCCHLGQITSLQEQTLVSGLAPSDRPPLGS